MNPLSHVSAPDLAVVVPIYNEAPNIAEVLREWYACFERVAPNFILFAVNDGSTDETASILARLSARFGVRLRIVDKRNGGHGSSCREGYELALSEKASWIFQIDSDGQCDPAFFARLYSLRHGNDCVFAYRQTRDDGWSRAAISACCRALLWLVTGKTLRDPNVPYRLISAPALRRALRRIPLNFDLQNIALSLALARDSSLRWSHCPIHFRARQGGTNSINCGKIVGMGLRLMRDLHRIKTDEDPYSGWWTRWTRRRLAS